MKAYAVKELQHPSKITLTTDWPEPVPKKDQLLVDVYAAGLNYYDILQAQGKYQIKHPLPFVLGTEFAGVVRKAPAGSAFKAGDRVFGAVTGAYAERVAVDPGAVTKLPETLSFEQAAGMYVTWPTSYEALVGRAKLQPGEFCLVTAAAGGVGMAAVQLAKGLGAKVIGAAGSQAKLDIVKKRGGADYVVDYTTKGWQQEVMKITGGKGVDVIYDPVGMITDCLKCIAWKGRALVVGFAAGSIEKVPTNLILLKNISLVGIFWGAYAIREPAHLPTVYREILDLLASGRVSAPVVYERIYSLETLSEGLHALETRGTYGKAVVRIKAEPTKAKL
ncbi:hypothetical protein HMN09_01372600 [Mycena chlorophos]|uniref:Enoyl reductase (ER) domain-containing protein n=1 Tax=Mycena chlorophos TaxID=658473 RepID=A0A8H6RXD0_MYCCL|nr:hypothetical protein HMN09_01372600 [Mycena chlorophos]